MSWNQSYGANCTQNKDGATVCNYPGPPARDGKDAYRVYKQQVGVPGRVYDVIEQPIHGRDAQCGDTPPLSWPQACAPVAAPPCPRPCDDRPVQWGPVQGQCAGWGNQSWGNQTWGNSSSAWSPSWGARSYRGF